MKKVCIIYTGGTIGMVQTERGFAPEQGALNKELLALKDLSAPDMPKWDLVEFDPLLDSSNTTYKEWNMMGEAIASRYDDYDGFVILHGTDTMAYTASALSFMLENLGKPVILTGSQIPLCQLRSDGKDNLITSLLIAADGVVPEVCLYFGNKLLRGNRAYKSSADRLIAFTSPNYPSLATAGIEISYNKELMLPKPDPDKKPFRLTKLRQTSIGVIKLHPGIHFDLFAPMVNENLEGLVLVGSEMCIRDRPRAAGNHQGGHCQRNCGCCGNSVCSGQSEAGGLRYQLGAGGSRCSQRREHDHGGYCYEAGLAAEPGTQPE